MTNATPAVAQESGVPDGRTTRWVGHRDARREEFIDRALVVIEEFGASASIEQIATACGVSRQVLYRHFTGRSDLDGAIADRAAAMIIEHLVAQIDASAGIAVGLRQVLEAYLEFVEAHTELYWFTRAHEAEDEADHPVARAIEDLVGVAVEAAEEQLATSGRTPSAPLGDVFAVGLIGLADAVVSRWLRSDRSLSRSEMIDGLVVMLTAAVEAVIGPWAPPVQAS